MIPRLCGESSNHKQQAFLLLERGAARLAAVARKARPVSAVIKVVLRWLTHTQMCTPYSDVQCSNVWEACVWLTCNWRGAEKWQTWVK